jgi:hypothetical protein
MRVLTKKLVSALHAAIQWQQCVVEVASSNTLSTKMWNSFFNSEGSLHADVGAAQIDALTAKSKVNDVAYRVKDLEEALLRSNLVAQALWEILRDKLAISDLELMAKVAEVDQRDGRRDQRVAPQLGTCPHCSRTVNTRHRKCIFCGEELPRPHAFQ